MGTYWMNVRSVRRVTPSRLEIYAGSGLPSALIGVGLLGLSLFVLLGGLGSIVQGILIGDPRVPAIEVPVVLLTGTSLVLLSAWIAFSRRTTVDAAQRKVEQVTYLVLPLRRRTLRLAEFTAVRLAWDGGGDGPDAEAIFLERGGKARALRVCTVRLDRDRRAGQKLAADLVATTGLPMKTGWPG